MSQQPTVFDQAAFGDMEKMFHRNFFNALAGFKSVNLVGTRSLTGQTNLAIFSQIFHVGATPPLMGLLVRPHTTDRHTLENILTTQAYTFNHILPEFYAQAHQTSARYPRDQSEFAAVGLTEAYSENPTLTAPYVQESAIQIGLELAERHDLTINGTLLLIGYVREVRLRPGIVCADGFLDLEAAQSVTCAGLDSYHTTQRLGRLAYAKPNLPPRPIQD